MRGSRLQIRNRAVDAIVDLRSYIPFTKYCRSYDTCLSINTRLLKPLAIIKPISKVHTYKKPGYSLFVKRFEFTHSEIQ